VEDFTLLSFRLSLCPVKGFLSTLSLSPCRDEWSRGMIISRFSLSFDSFLFRLLLFFSFVSFWCFFSSSLSESRSVSYVYHWKSYSILSASAGERDSKESETNFFSSARRRLSSFRWGIHFTIESGKRDKTQDTRDETPFIFSVCYVLSVSVHGFPCIFLCVPNSIRFPTLEWTWKRRKKDAWREEHVNTERQVGILSLQKGFLVISVSTGQSVFSFQ